MGRVYLETGCLLQLVEPIGEAGRRYSRRCSALTADDVPMGCLGLKVIDGRWSLNGVLLAWPKNGEQGSEDDLGVGRHGLVRHVAHIEGSPVIH